MNALATVVVCTMLSSALLPAGPAAGKDGWTVLSDDLAAFQPPTGKWYIAGGAKISPKFDRRLVGEPGRGTLINGKIGVTNDLITRQQWGDAEVSLEFMIPRGSNSGVKLHGVYEVQIFDSWKVVKPTGEDCGGIYPRAELKPYYHHIDGGIAPRLNAAKAPGEWQTLTIRFRAPRFDQQGRKILNARFEKVVLNGKLIHDNVEVAHPTGNVWREKEHARGPLLFQADHGPVAFRNIRVRPLPPAPPPAKHELQAADFNFHGPLGSDGARLKQIGVNHFELALGHAPAHPTWANMVQFEIVRHAYGNRLRLDVRFDKGQREYLFDDYPLSWSCDGRNWWQIGWSRGGARGKQRTLEFPEFAADRVIVGHQVPMSYEDAERLMAGWRSHPHVRVHVLGKSLEGRNLYRLTITDPASPHPPARRWVHHFANQHPLECCSQWRMAGMIDWLLSDQAAAHRQRTICHFTLMMSPDAASHGWYRTNREGFDMNRTYRAEGADQTRQTREAYVFQSDLEALMRSEAPVTTSWAMHTWQGLMDPIIRGQGPEMGKVVGPWEDLKRLLAKYDARELSKPLQAAAETKPEGHWDCGPFRQFGITNVLVEGGSHLDMQQNLDSGEALMRAIVEYYRGLRPAR
jgi:hypothetical protein